MNVELKYVTIIIVWTTEMASNCQKTVGYATEGIIILLSACLHA